MDLTDVTHGMSSLENHLKILQGQSTRLSAAPMSCFDCEDVNLWLVYTLRLQIGHVINGQCRSILHTFCLLARLKWRHLFL